MYDIDGVGPHRSNGVQASLACTGVFEDTDAVPFKTYNLTSSDDAECKGSSQSNWMAGLRAAPVLDGASFEYQGGTAETSEFDSACFFNDTIQIVQTFAGSLDLVVVDSAVHSDTGDTMLVVRAFGDSDNHMCLLLAGHGSGAS